MTTMATAHSLLLGLIGSGTAEYDIATSVVQATYDKIKLLGSTAALATREGLTQLYMAAYSLLAQQTAQPRTTRHLMAFAADMHQLDALFSGTAEVSCWMCGH